MAVFVPVFVPVVLNGFFFQDGKMNTNNIRRIMTLDDLLRKYTIDCCFTNHLNVQDECACVASAFMGSVSIYVHRVYFGPYYPDTASFDKPQ